MVPPVDHPTRLSVRRAFVIQFQADTVVEQGHLAGHVEHVVSGQATDQKYAEIDSQTGRPRGFRQIIGSRLLYNA